MKLRKIIAIVAAPVIPMAAHGAAGIYDELLWVTTTAPFAYGTSTFSEIDSDNSNLFGAAEFDGANLGIFTVGEDLYLTGQQKSFKNNGTDVSAHTLFWSLDGGTTFNTLGYGFQSDLGGGNQQWGADNTGGLTSNILSGLTAGNYTLSVWSTITTDGADSAPITIFNNKGGANYNATFSVIPEPSAALLGGLGVLALLRRRRI